LLYVLQVPEQPGDVQHDFHIEKEGSYLLLAKNPQHEGGGPDAAEERRHPRLSKFPDNLQSTFPANSKTAPVRDAAMLDFVGAELLLLGLSHRHGDDVAEELLAELRSGKQPDAGKLVREAMQDLSLPETVPREPLSSGVFK
jgi:hypothetical protein